LLKGDVFTKDVIETWIDWKEENEIKPSRLRPTQFEFAQYFTTRNQTGRQRPVRRRCRSRAGKRNSLFAGASALSAISGWAFQGGTESKAVAEQARPSLEFSVQACFLALG